MIRPHDASVSEHEWRSFLVSQGFGQLVAPGGPNRQLPVIVPTQFSLTEDAIVFHLAKANPVFEALEENPVAVMSVAGDWAYVPTTFKALATENPHDFVPTTYYAAVQVTGEIEIIDNPEALAAVLGVQLDELEPAEGLADATLHTKKYAAIRGLRLPVDPERVQAKFKYGGNVDAAHQDRAAEMLAGRDGPGDAAALSHLTRRRVQ